MRDYSQKTTVQFYGYDPFISVNSAHLLTPMIKWDKNHRDRPLSATRAQVSRLIQAEFCIRQAYRMWNKSCTRVLEAAKLSQPTPIGSGCLLNFGRLSTVNNAEGNDAALENELLVSVLLDAFYVLTERITSSTKELNSDSSNLIWNNIKSKTLGFSTGNQSIVEQNLVGMFLSDTGSALGPEQQESLKRLLDLRGARTHSVHYFMQVIEPDHEVQYTDELIFGATQPSRIFTNRDIELDFAVSFYFVNWWIGCTEKYLNG